MYYTNFTMEHSKEKFFLAKSDEAFQSSLHVMHARYFLIHFVCKSNSLLIISSFPIIEISFIEVECNNVPEEADKISKGNKYRQQILIPSLYCRVASTLAMKSADRLCLSIFHLVTKFITEALSQNNAFLLGIEKSRTYFLKLFCSTRKLSSWSSRLFENNIDNGISFSSLF